MKTTLLLSAAIAATALPAWAQTKTATFIEQINTSWNDPMYGPGVVTHAILG